MQQMLKSLIFTSLILLFIGCSYDVPTPKERFDTADSIAKQYALHTKVYKTKKYDIFSYSTDLSKCKQENLHLYIEGDGLAWVTSSTISDDPTPINPLALRLMVEDNAPCKLYLARPCQYIKNSQCTQDVWTSHRFSQNVIDSYNEILDSLQYKKLILFGYSGGGTVATLLSAQRNDVNKLVTIAGNLDIKYWAKKHYITPLKGSLNPINFVTQLKNVHQIHLIGGKDNIVGKSVFDSYKSHFADDTNIKYILYKNFTHSCCWVKEWKGILKELSN